ncbi:hypothetical protein HHK36_011749 [Tetracentron sinense]|uniref:Uncharacterized protein n=1 Tax=Tetracentron sinense TaxID=13715 RepID=A0A834ZDG4_TETSI|nr:hypothetical protein HHK36_011749 [Tetracentron sinense]
MLSSVFSVLLSCSTCVILFFFQAGFNFVTLSSIFFSPKKFSNPASIFWRLSRICFGECPVALCYLVQPPPCNPVDVTFSWSMDGLGMLQAHASGTACAELPNQEQRSLKGIVIARFLRVSKCLF